MLSVSVAIQGIVVLCCCPILVDPARHSSRKASVNTGPLALFAVIAWSSFSKHALLQDATTFASRRLALVGDVASLACFIISSQPCRGQRAVLTKSWKVLSNWLPHTWPMQALAGAFVTCPSDLFPPPPSKFYRQHRYCGPFNSEFRERLSGFGRMPGHDRRTKLFREVELRA